MNIIANSDVEKFLKLVKAGTQHGKKRELDNYTSATCYDGTDVSKEYYVSLKFTFMVDADVIERLFNDEDFDVSRKVNDLLSGINPTPPPTPTG